VALAEPAAPRPSSPPKLPYTPGKAWSCMNRESRVPRERHRPVLRLTGRRRPPRNHAEMRYAHTRQSLAGRTEQDPTNQHQIAATIALRSRLQRAVSPSLSSVWCNAPASDQLHFHAADRASVRIVRASIAADLPSVDDALERYYAMSTIRRRRQSEGSAPAGGTRYSADCGAS